MSKNKLKYEITADATGFEKAMRKVSDSASSVGKGISVGLAAGTASATAAIIGLNAALQDAGERARELDNMSRLANTNSEAFAKMAFAAEQFGISQEKLSDISTDVQDKLGDFIATGAGGFKDFFDNVAPKVGLAAE